MDIFQVLQNSFKLLVAYFLILISQMSRVLLRQFTEGPYKSFLTQYIKIIGHKNPRVLDQVIPNLTQNLAKSSQSIVDALINQDIQFIEETASLSLQRVIIPELENMKSSNISIKYVPHKIISDELAKKLAVQPNDLKDEKRFVISPYVIFGQKMEDRLKEENPWKNVYRVLSCNRYLYINPKESFNIKNILNNHVYGFQCYIKNLSKGFEITQGSKVSQYPPRYFTVTFETDSQNHEFYVTDINYMVQFKVV